MLNTHCERLTGSEREAVPNTQINKHADQYAMSFAVGGLMVSESRIAAEVFKKLHDWPSARRTLVDENLYQTQARSSAVRISGEVIKRLSVLNNEEIDILLSASPDDATNILWLAVCRRYTFIGDFASEVLRDRYVLRQRALDLEVFDEFVREKSMWHAELTEIKPSSMARCRSVIFRMMREAGFLRDGTIEGAVLTEPVRQILNQQEPSEIRFFPVFE